MKRRGIHQGTHHRNAVTLEDIIAVLSGIGIAASLIFLLGIYGGVECDTISLGQGIRMTAASLVCLILSIVGINMVEKEDQDKYDRL